MKFSRPLAVIFAFAFFGLLGFGLLVLASKTFGLLGSFDSRLLGILITAIVAALIMAGGIRSVARSADRQARLAAYLGWLQAWARVKWSQETEGDPLYEELRAAERALVLLAPPGVLKGLQRLHSLTSHDREFTAAVTGLLDEMRRDIGQSNSQLADDRLIELLSLPYHTGAGR